MRRTFFAFLSSIALLHTNAVLHACGDKFAIPGRLPSFDLVYAAIYPATILLDTISRAGGSAGMRDPRLQAAFTRAGHQVSRADNPALVGEALKSGKVELILADLADAEVLAREVAGSASSPIVLPVMTAKPTKAVTDACRAAFGDRCQLKASDKPERFLRVIDDAMDARAKARKAKKG